MNQRRLRIWKREQLRSCGSTWSAPMCRRAKGQAALNTADRYAGNAYAHATTRAYRSDWPHFGD